MSRVLAILTLVFSIVALLGVAGLAAQRTTPLPLPPPVDPQITSIPREKLQQQLGEMKTQMQRMMAEIQGLHETLASSAAAHAPLRTPKIKTDRQMAVDSCSQELMSYLDISSDKAQTLASTLIHVTYVLNNFMRTNPKPQKAMVQIEAARNDLFNDSERLLTPEQRHIFAQKMAPYFSSMESRIHSGPITAGTAGDPNGPGITGVQSARGPTAPNMVTPPGSGAGSPPPQNAADF